MPEVTLRAVRRGRRRSRPRWRCAASSRTRSARTPPPSSSTSSSRCASRTRPTRPAGRPRRLRAWASRASAREIAAPTLILAGTADNVVDYRNAELLADADPGRARRAVRGRRAPVLLGAARRVRHDRRRSSSDEPAHHRPLHPRPRPDRRRPGSRSRSAAANWTYAELDARSDELARRSRARAPRRPCLDAHRQLRRARRADVRLREGGRDPAPDLVAARSAPRSRPARRRRAGALPDRGRARGARRGGARACARRRAALGDRATSARRCRATPPTTTRCS